MKALSIKQPWAELIATSVKDIENRTWRASYRGMFYIHASQKSAGTFTDLLSDLQQDVCPLGVCSNIICGAINYGAIIGHVTLVDCVKYHPSLWAEKGVWNWVLENPVKYEKPIVNVKGALSFWDFN
jgi:hypothetical protein